MITFQPQTNNPWVRDGDFNIRQSTSDHLLGLREAEYRNILGTRSLIRKIQLYQWRYNGSIVITLKSAEGRYQELVDATNAGEHPHLSIASEHILNLVEIKTDAAHFNNLIEYITRLAIREPELSHILPEMTQGIRIAGQETMQPGNAFIGIADYLELMNDIYTPDSAAPTGEASVQQALMNQSFAEHYGHTSASYRPSTSNINSNNLSLGKNADLLSDLDVDVPNVFECPLSGYIMTDPVYFKGLASKNIQCFERDWIMDHLRRDKKHPITREQISKDTLVENNQLKLAMNDFAHRKAREHSRKKLKQTH